MDEVILYDYALTAEEVLAIYEEACGSTSYSESD